MKEELVDPVQKGKQVVTSGKNVSFYASAKIRNNKTKLFYKYGHGSFSKYVAKAMAEKEERDGGLILDMDEIEHD